LPTGEPPYCLFERFHRFSGPLGLSFGPEAILLPLTDELLDCHHVGAYFITPFLNVFGESCDGHLFGFRPTLVAHHDGFLGQLELGDLFGILPLVACVFC
jgi:hypothetical protein